MAAEASVDQQQAVPVENCDESENDEFDYEFSVFDNPLIILYYHFLQKSQEINRNKKLIGACETVNLIKCKLRTKSTTHNVILALCQKVKVLLSDQEMWNTLVVKSMIEKNRIRFTITHSLVQAIVKLHRRRVQALTSYNALCAFYRFKEIGHRSVSLKRKYPRHAAGHDNKVMYDKPVSHNEMIIEGVDGQQILDIEFQNEDATGYISSSITNRAHAVDMVESYAQSFQNLDQIKLAAPSPSVTPLAAVSPVHFRELSALPKIPRHHFDNNTESDEESGQPLTVIADVHSHPRYLRSNMHSASLAADLSRLENEPSTSPHHFAPIRDNNGIQHIAKVSKSMVAPQIPEIDEDIFSDVQMLASELDLLPADVNVDHQIRYAQRVENIVDKAVTPPFDSIAIDEEPSEPRKRNVRTRVDVKALTRRLNTEFDPNTLIPLSASMEDAIEKHWLSVIDVQRIKYFLSQPNIDLYDWIQFTQENNGNVLCFPKEKYKSSVRLCQRTDLQSWALEDDQIQIQKNIGFNLNVLGDKVDETILTDLKDYSELIENLHLYSHVMGILRSKVKSCIGLGIKSETLAYIAARLVAEFELDVGEFKRFHDEQQSKAGPTENLYQREGEKIGRLELVEQLPKHPEVEIETLTFGQQSVTLRREWSLVDGQNESTDYLVPSQPLAVNIIPPTPNKMLSENTEQTSDDVPPCKNVVVVEEGEAAMIPRPGTTDILPQNSETALSALPSITNVLPQDQETAFGALPSFRELSISEEVRIPLPVQKDLETFPIQTDVEPVTKNGFFYDDDLFVARKNRIRVTEVGIMNILNDYWERKGEARFSELCPQGTLRLVIAKTFGHLLNLHKKKAVRLEAFESENINDNVVILPGLVNFFSV